MPRKSVDIIFVPERLIKAALRRPLEAVRISFSPVRMDSAVSRLFKPVKSLERNPVNIFFFMAKSLAPPLKASQNIAEDLPGAFAFSAGSCGCRSVVRSRHHPWKRPRINGFRTGLQKPYKKFSIIQASFLCNTPGASPGVPVSGMGLRMHRKGFFSVRAQPLRFAGALSAEDSSVRGTVCACHSCGKRNACRALIDSG